MLKKIILLMLGLSPVLNVHAGNYSTETYYKTVEKPRQVCWNESTSNTRRSGDYTGVILGGLAGGIIGNQVGKGNGKMIATALGATTGAIVGDNLSERRYNNYTERHCKTVMEQVRVPVTRQVPIEQEIVYVNQRQTIVKQPVYILNQQPNRSSYYDEYDREYGHRKHHGHGHHGHHGRGHHYGWYE